MREKRPDLHISVIVGGEVREGCCPLGEAGPEDFLSRFSAEKSKGCFGLAEAAGVARSFRFAGARRQEELRVFYSAADAMAITSRYETFSLVALEAAAAGCRRWPSGWAASQARSPTVRAGSSYRDGDAAAFTEAALELIASPEVRAKLGEGARKRAKSLSWGSAAKKELNVWNGLLESRRGRSGNLLESARV